MSTLASFKFPRELSKELLQAPRPIRNKHLLTLSSVYRNLYIQPLEEPGNSVEMAWLLAKLCPTTGVSVIGSLCRMVSHPSRRKKTEIEVK